MEHATDYVLSQREACKSISLYKDGIGHFFAKLKWGRFFKKEERVTLSFDQFEYLKTILQLKRMKRRCYIKRTRGTYIHS